MPTEATSRRKGAEVKATTSPGGSLGAIPVKGLGRPTTGRVAPGAWKPEVSV
jgi:hypothetical protein